MPESSRERFVKIGNSHYPITELDKACEDCGQFMVVHCNEDIQKALDAVRAEERASIRIQTLQEIWDRINLNIPAGTLEGNGLDKVAERNGLIWATNIVFNLAEGKIDVSELDDRGAG